MTGILLAHINNARALCSFILFGKSNLIFFDTNLWMGLSFLIIALGYFTIFKGILQFIELNKYGQLSHELHHLIKEINPFVPIITPKASLEKNVIINEDITQDSLIDTLIVEIKDKTTQLKNYQPLNIEKKMILEKTLSNYLPQIIKNYKTSFPNLRRVPKKDGTTIYDNTVEQLKILKMGLDELQMDILSENDMKQKSLKNFLEKRFNKTLSPIEEKKWID